MSISPPEPGTQTRIAFKFSGTTKDWFRICIIDLLLSIATLGIYSAWATARRKRYFHTHTSLGDHSFDYYGTGPQILLGRVGAVIATFALITWLLHIAGLVVGAIWFVALLVATIVFVIYKLRFNARMTSFANTWFTFKGRASLWLLVCVLVVYPVVILNKFIFGSMISNFNILLLVVGCFALDRTVKNYIVYGHQLGSCEISAANKSATSGWLVSFVLFVLAMSLLAAITTVASFMAFVVASSYLEDTLPNIGVAKEIIAFSVYSGAYILALWLAWFIYKALNRNAILNTLQVGEGHRFSSEINPLKLIWIGMSNIVIVACTVGLMLPWAQIRLARYLADHTFAIRQGPLDNVIDAHRLK